MNVKEIIHRFIKKSRLDYCAICGKCLAVCPTYRELNVELHSPRGRLNLIRAFLDAELGAAGEKFFEALDWCLLCGACTTICPAQIQPAEAILFARALPEFRLRQSFWEKFMLQRVVTHQSRLSMVNTAIRLAQKTGVLELVRESKLRRFLPSHLVVMSELIPAHTGKSLSPHPRQSRRLTSKVTTSSRPQIAFFIGCAMNLVLPEILSDSMKLLNAAGFTVSIPDEFYCCGAPHLHEGDLQTALSLCKTNVKMLAELESDIITSDCDSCVAMLKRYSELLAGTELEKLAQQVSQRTLALSEFLASSCMTSLEFENFGDVRVTWDDPCELIHAQGISHAPRAILQKLPGVRFLELPEAEWCCGCAGAFILKHPDLSQQILSRKLSAIKSLEVDFVLTSNPGCFLQLSRGIRQSGLKCEVQYLTTFLARYLRYNSAD